MKRTVLVTLLLVFVMSICHVVADGYSGYESGDFLGHPYMNTYARVCSKSVTIRTEASYNGRKVQSASNGDLLKVYNQQGNWTYISYEKDGNTYEGWVITSYIVIEPTTLTLMSSNIPAYCAPDRSSKLVGSLASGTELTVLGTWDDFYIVNLRQASAFIPMDADVIDTVGLYYSLLASTRYGTTVRDTKIYNGAGDNWEVIGSIPAGVNVLCGNSFGGFVAVNYNGITGFVRESDMNFTFADEGNG